MYTATGEHILSCWQAARGCGGHGGKRNSGLCGIFLRRASLLKRNSKVQHPPGCCVAFMCVLQVCVLMCFENRLLGQC